MQTPNMMVLYVDDAAASGAFYADLLGLQPVETAPTFRMFALDSGLQLGLKSRHAVEPPVAPTSGASGGGTELGLPVADAAAVDATHRAWTNRGLTILQPPTTLPFGRTFVACDPDGHRLRVFAVNAQ